MRAVVFRYQFAVLFIGCFFCLVQNATVGWKCRKKTVFLSINAIHFNFQASLPVVHYFAHIVQQYPLAF